MPKVPWRVATCHERRVNDERSQDWIGLYYCKEPSVRNACVNLGRRLLVESRSER
jgi:hypothetical protein